MRLNNVFSGRPQYYDRNPSQVATNTQAQGVVPHGATNRQSYTVPSNRKCLIHTCNQTIQRTIVATTPLDYFGYSQNSLGTFSLVHEFIRNAVGDFRENNASIQVTFLAGQTLTQGDQDNSTGGAVSYQHSFAGTEYDA